jgi:hypothetical protein
MRWCCRRFPERPLAISFRLLAPDAAGPCGPIIGICRATPQKHDIRLSFSGAHAHGRRKAPCISADLTGVTVTQLSCCCYYYYYVLECARTPNKKPDHERAASDESWSSLFVRRMHETAMRGLHACIALLSLVRMVSWLLFLERD